MVLLMENMKLEVMVVLASSPNAQNHHRHWNLKPQPSGPPKTYTNLHLQPSGKTPTTTTNLWCELQEEREQNTVGTGDEQIPLNPTKTNKNTITERKRWYGGQERTSSSHHRQQDLHAWRNFCLCLLTKLKMKLGCHGGLMLLVEILESIWKEYDMVVLVEWRR
jgi:hypothetical protein